MKSPETAIRTSEPANTTSPFRQVSTVNLCEMRHACTTFADQRWTCSSERHVSGRSSRTISGGRAETRRAATDLRSLERQGLIEERTVTRLRDGAVADVIAVTDEGKALLDHHRDPHLDVGQEYYAGWVKPAEMWHDASLFHMCWEMESELGREGAHITRVILDDELKARAYEALHETRETKDDDHDARRTVAGVQGLHLGDDDRFVFPDVRLEVEDRDGTIRTVDLERITEHYHRGHISGKAGAGFQMFRGASSSSRRGTPHDPHTIGKLLR